LPVAASAADWGEPMFTDAETTSNRRCSARLAKIRETLATQHSLDGSHPTPSKKRRLVLQWKAADGTRRQASASSSHAVLAQEAIQATNSQTSAASPSLDGSSASCSVPLEALDPVGYRAGNIGKASSKRKNSLEEGVSSGSGKSVIAHGHETAASAEAIQGCISSSRGRKANFGNTATSGIRGPATERWLLPRFTGAGGARWARPDPHCPTLGPSARLLPWPGWPNAPDPLGVLPVSLLDSSSEHYIQCDGCGEWLQVNSQVVTIYRKPQNLAFFCRYLTGKACRSDFRNPPGMALLRQTKKKRH